MLGAFENLLAVPGAPSPKGSLGRIDGELKWTAVIHLPVNIENINNASAQAVHQHCTADATNTKRQNTK